MKKWLTGLGVVILLLAGGLLAHTQFQSKIISADFGGSIGDYIEQYAEIRHDKVLVRIEDVCISACTMVLGLIPADRVCADKRAKFGFHSAWFMGPLGPVFSREGTRLVWNIYPENVREELKKRGWDGEGEKPHPDLLYVDATTFVRQCDG